MKPLKIENLLRNLTKGLKNLSRHKFAGIKVSILGPTPTYFLLQNDQGTMSKCFYGYLGVIIIIIMKLDHTKKNEL